MLSRAMPHAIIWRRYLPLSHTPIEEKKSRVMLMTPVTRLSLYLHACFLTPSCRPTNLSPAAMARIICYASSLRD